MKSKNLFIILAAAAAAAVSVVCVANIDAYAPLPHALESKTSRLEEFCERYWGVMSRDLTSCRFEQTHYFSLTRVGGELAFTGIPVIAGDVIRFEATEGAVPVVGKHHYENSAPEFTAAGEGYLSFRAPYGAGLVSLRKVRQLRCFRQEGRVVRPAPCEG